MLKTKLPLGIYYGLSFVIPTALAAIFSFIYSEEVFNHIWRDIFRFVSILLVVPIIIIYSFIMVKEYFPKRVLSSWLIVGKLVILTAITYIFSKKLPATIALQGTIFICGFVFVLLTGFALSVRKHWPDKCRLRCSVGRLAAIITLATPFIFVLSFYLLTGWHYIKIYPTHPNLFYNNIFFAIQLALVFSHFLPKAIVLYKRGKL